MADIDLQIDPVTGRESVPEPGLPPTPPFATAGTGGHGFVQGSMDAAHIGDLAGLSPLGNVTQLYALTGAGATSLQMTGSFGMDSHGVSGGTLQQFQYTAGIPTKVLSLDVSFDHGGPIGTFGAFVSTDDTQQAFATILAGADTLNGSFFADLIRGYAGNDVLAGVGGPDTIYGGQGDDQIYAGRIPGQPGEFPVGSTYLRGEEGNDYIVGGDAFDDINGNQGDDTISGGIGDDWVVGGKDNDLQFGDVGDDIVWGNLGNDTLEGGDGNDQIRGGQGDDVLFGDAGNDYISGDRGNDTETGGAGADIFHSFSGAGIDRVLDFNVGEGDKVMLDPGTSFTLKQVGADTVVDMGGGDQLILVGVQMSSLPPGTVFLG